MRSKTADDALITFACLPNDAGTSTGAEALAKETQVPRRSLNESLQGLVSAEPVLSRSGPGGGYLPARKATEITIPDEGNAVAPLKCIQRCCLGWPLRVAGWPLQLQQENPKADTGEAFSELPAGHFMNSGSPVFSVCDASSPNVEMRFSHQWNDCSDQQTGTRE
jgi:hypothetical protein